MKHAGNQGGRPRKHPLTELGMLVMISGNPVKLVFATVHEAYLLAQAVSICPYMKRFRAKRCGRCLVVSERTSK